MRSRIRVALETGDDEELIQACRLVVLDAVIDEDEDLEAVTGQTAENFDRTAATFETRMNADSGTPLYRGRPGRECDPGRRSGLLPRHRLLMYLESVRHDLPQKKLAATYGVSQPSVCRCIASTEALLADVLPTPDAIRARVSKARTVAGMQRAVSDVMNLIAELAGCGPGEGGGTRQKTLPGGVLIRDGTHVPVGRAHDKATRDRDYSGKKKTYTKNTLVTTNKRGVVLALSECEPGSTHDMEVLRLEGDDDLGVISRVLRGASRALLIVEHGDKGFQGMHKLHVGATVKTPHKRPPRPRKKKGAKRRRPRPRLPPDKVAENARMARTRVTIEHTNGRMKRFRKLRGRFRGSARRMRATANIVAGIVNQHLLTGSPDPANTHRKGRKPGPKTYRNRRR